MAFQNTPRVFEWVLDSTLKVYFTTNHTLNESTDKNYVFFSIENEVQFVYCRTVRRQTKVNFSIVEVSC
jgi:hypothetical protein